MRGQEKPQWKATFAFAWILAASSSLQAQNPPGPEPSGKKSAPGSSKDRFFKGVIFEVIGARETGEIVWNHQFISLLGNDLTPSGKDPIPTYGRSILRFQKNIDAGGVSAGLSFKWDLTLTLSVISGKNRNGIFTDSDYTLPGYEFGDNGEVIRRRGLSGLIRPVFYTYNYAGGQYDAQKVVLNKKIWKSKSDAFQFDLFLLGKNERLSYSLNSPLFRIINTSAIEPEIIPMVNSKAIIGHQGGGLGFSLLWHSTCCFYTKFSVYAQNSYSSLNLIWRQRQLVVSQILPLGYEYGSSLGLGVELGDHQIELSAGQKFQLSATALYINNHDTDTLKNKSDLRLDGSYRYRIDL